MKKFQYRHLLLAAATLAAASSAHAAVQVWNNGGPTDTWSLLPADTNWVSPTTWANGNDATFNGTGESITLGAGVTAHTLLFSTSGYSINSDTLTLVTAGAGATVTNSTDTATISSIVAGSVGFTKAGAGTLVLTGANTYTGTTAVTGGILEIGTGGSLGSGTYTGAITLSSGTTFRYANNATQNLSGQITLTGGTLDIADGQVNLAKAGVNQLGNTAGLILIRDGGILNASTAFAHSIYAFNFELRDGGTLTSSATVGQYGNYYITTGSHVITGTGSNNQVTAGKIGLDGALTLATALSTDSLSITSQLGSNTTSNNTTGSIIKTGAGTVTLSGANIYTGVTTVSGGTLLVNGNSSLATGNLASAATTTLGGTGTIGAALSTVNGNITGGTATTVGTLNTKALTLGATGVYLAQIDSGALTADKLVVTGALNLNAASVLTLTDLGGTTVGLGEVLTLATYTTITGSFANRADDSIFTLGANQWQIDYGTNALTLTAVPEPSTYGLIGAGALAAVAFVRRRRKLAGNVA
jgi:fibronectin-binding autotransporter adhesin